MVVWKTIVSDMEKHVELLYLQHGESNIYIFGIDLHEI